MGQLEALQAAPENAGMSVTWLQRSWDNLGHGAARATAFIQDS